MTLEGKSVSVQNFRLKPNACTFRLNADHAATMHVFVGGNWKTVSTKAGVYAVEYVENAWKTTLL